jgi:hypothetical protein
MPKKNETEITFSTRRQKPIRLEADKAWTADIFFAIYGTTTNAEIEAALSAGKEVLCKLTHGGVDYYLPLTRVDDASTHRFASQNITETGVRTVGALCSSNVWSSRSYKMMIAPANPSAGDVPMYDGSVWVAAAVPTEVFWATYGTTTETELRTAVNNGCVVLCTNGNDAGVYMLTAYTLTDDGDYFLFSTYSGGTYIKCLECIQNTWRTANQLIPSASTSTPKPLGTAQKGTATAYARGDHVHAMPSAADVGAVKSDWGVENAGKTLMIGSDGKVTAV